MKAAVGRARDGACVPPSGERPRSPWVITSWPPPPGAPGSPRCRAKSGSPRAPTPRCGPGGLRAGPHAGSAGPQFSFSTRRSRQSPHPKGWWAQGRPCRPGDPNGKHRGPEVQVRAGPGGRECEVGEAEPSVPAARTGPRAPPPGRDITATQRPEPEPEPVRTRTIK